MKRVNLFFALIISTLVSCSGQVEWSKANNWKIYRIQGPSVFGIDTDTLKHIKSYDLNQDSINSFLGGLKELHNKPVWMGAYVASYNFNGEIRKVEISQYGGFFHDDLSGKYFQLSEDNRDAWLDYLHDCYIAAYNK